MTTDINKISQLGIYWGSQSLFFTDVAADVPSLSFDFKHTMSVDNQFSNQDFGITEDNPVTSLIKETLNKKNLTERDVSLSLPTKDVIFRSFVIPWMPPNEMENVVRFEASKYLPFGLNELSYAYHAIVFTKDSNKRYRIIFVAIRNEALTDYLNIIQNADLALDIVEPADMSLLRALIHKGILSLEESVTLVHKEKNSGKILIVHEGIPHFVREFQLSFGVPKTEEGTADESSEEDPMSLVLRLVNEIRISIDYFKRQDNQLELNKVIILSDEDNPEIEKRIKSDLKMDMVSVQMDSIIQGIPDNKTPYIYAYGAGLYNTVNLPVEFNLTGERPKSRKKKKSSALFDAASKAEHRELNIKGMIIACCISAAILGLSYMTTTMMKKGKVRKLDTIKAELGTFAGLSQGAIESKNKDLAEKNDRIGGIIAKSDVAPLADIIGDLLPDGVWLDEFEVTLESGKQPPNIRRGQSTDDLPYQETMTATISGYAYLENTQGQFLLANNFLRNIKKSVAFSEKFEEIEIENTDTRNLEGYRVTYFKIRCK